MTPTRGEFSSDQRLQHDSPWPMAINDHQQSSLIITNQIASLNVKLRNTDVPPPVSIRMRMKERRPQSHRQSIPIGARASAPGRSLTVKQHRPPRASSASRGVRDPDEFSSMLFEPTRQARLLSSFELSLQSPRRSSSLLCHSHCHTASNAVSPASLGYAPW